MKNENNPLVSIIIITYNSSKFVLETLESAKAQTYQNIELIISDDGSKDKTIEICETWLEKNKVRFVRVKLITSKKNTGISANLNRGVIAANGNWIKTIAGDDILEKDILSNYINKIRGSKDVHFIYSSILKIDEDSKFISKIINEWDLYFGSLNPVEQNQVLLKRGACHAPTWMFSKALYFSVGGFNELYACFEDRPFLIKATSLGYKIFYLDIIGVKYRVSKYSVQYGKGIVISCYEESKIKYMLDFFDLSIKYRFYLNFKLRVLLFLKFLFSNKNRYPVNILLRLFK